MHFDQLRRREFIALLGGAAGAWPLAARARQADRVRRVGVLIGTGEAEAQARYEPFREGLAQLRWKKARNIRFDYRWTEDRQVARPHPRPICSRLPMR
jgi:putative ABC transport system substrate-binding protein